LNAQEERVLQQKLERLASLDAPLTPERYSEEEPDRTPLLSERN
jgi:hypothetical protein